MDDLLNDNLLLMDDIEIELSKADKDISDIKEKQSNIKKSNQYNTFILNRISDIFFRIYSKFNKNKNETINKNIQKEEKNNNNIKNDNNDLENKIKVMKNKSEIIKKKLIEQNEHLDDIILETDNNIENNNLNLTKIKKLF